MNMIDVERTDVPFICKTLGCHPVASADHFSPEALANVDLVEEVAIGGESNCTKVDLFSSHQFLYNSSLLEFKILERPFPFSSELPTKIFSPR